MTGVGISGITGSTATLVQGETLQLIAVISPVNATNKNVSWTSGNSSVASVNSGGLVTANSPGTASITVTTQNKGLKSTIAIIVTPTPSITSVKVNPQEVSIIQGQSYQLTAVVEAVGGADETVTWESYDTTGKVSVNSNGRVTVAADAPTGNYTVAAISTKDNSKLGTAAITVTALPKIVFAFDPGTVTLSEIASRGTWYKDRYSPKAFEVVMFDGDYRLRQKISDEDSEQNRTGNFSDSFYNTQGRKYDTTGITKMSIDLYIPRQWQNTNNRMAGFWGTGFDAESKVSLYPIIEFTSEDFNPRFRVYVKNTWVDLGLPEGFQYNAWYTLSIRINSDSEIEVSVGNLSYTIRDIEGTTSMGNVILQGHNTETGVNYDIHWDNFKAFE